METVTTIQTYEDAVLKTVMFWSDKSFRTALNQNNGDDSANGGMAFLLMNMVSMNAKRSVTDDQIKRFEEKLKELLLAVRNEAPYTKTLDVDYHPCEMLSQAAEYAGIDASCFPCKTFTKISNNNEVTAKYQYGGALITL